MLNSLMTLPQWTIELPNAEESDTREDESSNAVKFIIIYFIEMGPFNIKRNFPYSFYILIPPLFKILSINHSPLAKVLHFCK